MKASRREKGLERKQQAGLNETKAEGGVGLVWGLCGVVYRLKKT